MQSKTVSMGSSKKESQVHLEMLRLGERCDTLASIISQLEERLTIILLSESPQSTEESKEVTEREKVALASDIKYQTDRITSANNRLSELIGRVEL